MTSIQIWLFTVLKSRPFRRSVLVVGLLAPAAFVPFLPHLFFRMNESYAQLHIEEAIVVPVDEVSGMAVRSNQNGNRPLSELFVVGDRNSKLWSANVEGDILTNFAIFDLKVPMKFAMSECSENPTTYYVPRQTAEI